MEVKRLEVKVKSLCKMLYIATWATESLLMLQRRRDWDKSRTTRWGLRSRTLTTTGTRIFSSLDFPVARSITITAMARSLMSRPMQGFRTRVDGPRALLGLITTAMDFSILSSA